MDGSHELMMLSSLPLRESEFSQGRNWLLDSWDRGAVYRERINSYRNYQE